jgi:hypothetical protein
MIILVFLEIVIGGAFLGSLMLALLKNLHSERTGLINRWHYFFWYLWIPRLIPWTLVTLFSSLPEFLCDEGSYRLTFTPFVWLASRRVKEL